MATFAKRGDSWRAQVRIAGRKPVSRTFDTKALARAWADDLEESIKRGHKPGRHTFGDAVETFRDEVTPTRKGERWETIRLNKFLADHADLMRERMETLGPDPFIEWKRQRMRQVSAGSVLREMNLMRSVLEYARIELRWIKSNPIADVAKPPKPASRKRRVSDDERDRIGMALGWDGGAPRNASQRVAVAFAFAIETGMRSGEITSLTWPQVHARHAHLDKTKNGDERDVPLSARARELLALLPKDADKVFNVNAALRDALFRKAKKAAHVDGLTFHDSRHEATTRLARKLPLLDLARMIGHRDLRSLQIYYNPTADELSDRLG